MLRYTGHPIADIGVATITAFRQKTKPEDLNDEDLEQTAEYLLTQYTSGVLTPYLSCVFTMNASYTQPSWKQAQREQESRELLFSFRREPDPAATSLRCIFSGEPASRIVYRQHVPMLTGEGVLNFFPAGTGGLPISGPYLLAIQAFPLGALRCFGRALAVHSPDDPGLTYAFARRFLVKNRQLLLLTEQSGEKYQDAKAPKTVIAHALLEIEEERRERSEDEPAPSVTVYHLTNSGQGPDITLFHLPSQVVQFLRLASRAGTQQIWRRIEAAAWEKVESEKPKSGEKKRKEGKRTKAEAERSLIWGPGISRNYLYEDLFDLPERATYFVRTYFLRRAYRAARQPNDPRRAYRLSQDLELVSWELTRVFLKEVIGMEKIRIEAIRILGDRLADYISSDNDRRFFQGFYRTNQYGVLRNLLIKSCNACLRKGQPPLIGLDEFLLVFEEGEETPRRDWRLARDLVLIRIIEELYKKGWFGKQPDVLEGLDTDEEERNGATS
ncbi:MAG: type I-B CRISPR-associated protein Cas8b1/Cst1 [Thermodesulfobacteriota bacterium]